ncbi:MAG: HEAT repeat domain-containing protein [Candidatus Abyssobacteria bacterium SURF_17]|jgi:hypothetical protein|uniref:HEAT repeat domain-containing protein n=1 Tax=Candidatus Abyssobacteria bacterium SURF_17 TaxID=2093361 RepID=A0A419F053_9BACT|nr:MAG: HEAT repeat domain-containing protein [Candidatus Abyssubacteria bacterium SURF_17]
MRKITLMMAVMLCSATLSSLAVADTITLKTGQKYEGDIIAEEEERIQLKMDGSGARVWFSRDQIASMAKAEPTATDNTSSGPEGSSPDAAVVDDEVERARELLNKMREQSKETPDKKEKTNTIPTVLTPEPAPGPAADAKTKTEVERLVEQVNTGKGAVRINACKRLGDLGSDEAVPHLIHFLDDDSYYVRDAANQSLIKITGQNFGFDSKASRSVRMEAVEKWEKWYKDEQKKEASSRFKSFW